MSELSTESITNKEQGSIKEQDIPEKEKAFLTDTTSQVWMKTNTGKIYLPLNYMKMFAEKAYPLFEKLKHKENIELFGFSYSYYDQTDSQGNKIPDSIGRVYRYPKGTGGGKPQYKVRYAKQVFKGLEGPTNEKLADPNGKWKVITSHYDPNEREVIFTLVREE